MLTLAQQFCKISRDTGTDFSVLHSHGVLGFAFWASQSS